MPFHAPPTNVAALGGAPASTIGTPNPLGGASLSAGATTLPITTTAAAPTGSMIAVFVAGGDNTVSVADSAGNTYAALTEVVGSSVVGRIFYKLNAAALPSGGLITVTYLGATGAHWATAISITGILTVGAFDAEAGNASASSTGLTLTSGTLAQASEIALAMTMVGTGGSDTWTEATGFTSLPTVGASSKLRPAYQIVAATTSVAYAPLNSVARSIVECLATFKAA